jgi:hypothetical protein
MGTDAIPARISTVPLMRPRQLLVGVINRQPHNRRLNFQLRLWAGAAAHPIFTSLTAERPKGLEWLPYS